MCTISAATMTSKALLKTLEISQRHNDKFSLTLFGIFPDISIQETL